MVEQYQIREIMEECGYDPSEVHPECYRNFSWINFAEKFGNATREFERAKEILNTPILQPFMEAAVAEAKHQRYRWGGEDDAKKTAWDWFWTLGYLGGKAAQASLAGDWDKAKHHTITAAALLANWHRHIAEANR